MDRSTIKVEIPGELFYKFLLFLPYDELIKYGQLNSDICRSNQFWVDKASYDFNISPTVFMITTLSPKQRYLELLNRYNKLTKEPKYNMADGAKPYNPALSILQEYMRIY